MKLSEVLALFDFEFYLEEGKIALIDTQGANLGGIESERFDTVEEVFDRMDIYIHDTCLDGEILIDEDGRDFKTVQEAYDYCNENEYEYERKLLYAVLNPETVEVM